jgi:predicted nucleotidyltransferase
MNRAAEYLAALARRVADAYLALAPPHAVLLTGSAASGECDEYSDLDLMVYYDTPPTGDELTAVHERLGVTDLRLLGSPEEGAFIEIYTIAGVQCQVGPIPIAHLLRDIAAVQEGLDVASPTQKVLAGLLSGVPLHGADLIAGWQSRAAAYPDALAHAMVEHYARQIFPVWYYAEVIARRDAALWRQQLLVEATQGILGILAGLNRVYYSPFQFKHQRRFVAALPLAPAALADRLDHLLAAPPAEAIALAEALVREILALTARHLPDADTASLARSLGERARPWQLPAQ